MKIAIYQTIVGGGGGIDTVLFTLLKKLAKDDVTVFCQSNMIKLNVKTRQLLPFRLPFFGIYQNLLNISTPKEFAKFDQIYILSGSMVINKSGKPAKYLNSNNFGLSVGGKYKSGLWRLYYIPFLILMKRFKNKIKESDMEFVSNSRYTAEKLEDDFGVKSTVKYLTIDPAEFHSESTKSGVLTLSRFSPEKNMEFAINVFAGIGSPLCKIYANLSAANKPYYNRIIQKNTSVFLNQKRDVIIDALARAKVYFHPCEETFGLAVVEAMASGCIPIVPGNSAHIETVPFPELWYYPDSLNHAIQKISEALDGKYDYLLPKLKLHVRNFI